MSWPIRAARPQDVPRLPAIEERAGALFAGQPLTLVGGLVSEQDHSQACEEGRLLVAVDERDEPIAFALMMEVDGQAHLEELDVLPEYGRKGIGSALVEATFQWARQRGKRVVTLSTFREVPWNAPFYRRLGFEELEERELGPELETIRGRETEKGLNPRERCMMRKVLTP